MRVGQKYQMYRIISALIFWLGLGIGVGILVMFDIWTNKWLYIAAGGVFLVSVVSLIHALVTAKTYHVQTTAVALEINQGRLFRKQQTIFLNKIYSVAFAQNVLMQKLNLAKLVVKTVDHDVDIDGLSAGDAQELKDWLNANASR